MPAKTGLSSGSKKTLLPHDGCHNNGDELFPILSYVCQSEDGNDCDKVTTTVMQNGPSTTYVTLRVWGFRVSVTERYTGVGVTLRSLRLLLKKIARLALYIRLIALIAWQVLGYISTEFERKWNADYICLTIEVCMWGGVLNKNVVLEGVVQASITTGLGVSKRSTQRDVLYE